jgi:formate hydrogenlyase subunit 3/multisubunit Na+/H+ antiporter MnhD subunit
MKLQNKIILTTFALFMTEAVIHYNFGKRDCEKKQDKKGIIPPTKSLIRLAVVVGIFSFLNEKIIKQLK